MRTVASAITRVPILDASTTVQDASAAMLDAHVEVAVVVDDSAVRGLLTAGDVASALAAGDVTFTPVIAVAGAEPTLIGTRESLADAHERMHATGASVAVVVDDDGRPLGVLADHAAAI